ncbi:magnesium transporter CorA family protein [Candidatus Woesearchaeota archaeon]|nr:magnesium transporter CorA family protein [Candidatus Woesearchaeota archaeon]
MIELFLLKEENIQRLEHSYASKTLEWMNSSGKGTIWIRCVNHNSEDLEALAELTKIPIEEFKESLDENERSKVSVSKHLEIVYRAPTAQNGEIITLPAYIYSIGSLIVTIERTPLKVLSDLSAALMDNKRRFLFKKPGGYFIFYVLDKVNDEFLHFMDKISIKVEMFRDRGALSKENIQKIYDSSIALSYFNQAIIANIEALNELRKSYYKLFSPEDRKNFSELYYDALQILDTEKVQRDVLTNLFNMHSTISGNEMNYFMKIVALVALLSTLPNIITSIFSMNIKHTPIIDGQYAFYVILAVIIMSSAASYFVYKLFSRKWQ